MGDTSQLYPYQSHLEASSNFGKETQESSLLCKSWSKNTTGHKGVIAVGKKNAGLNACAATFAKSFVVQLIGHPQSDVLNQERLISPNLDLYMKLMPLPNNFECNSAAPGQLPQQEIYNLVN